MPTSSCGPRIAYRITDEYCLVRVHGTRVLYLEWREKGRPKRRTTGCTELAAAKASARDLILEHATVVAAAPEEAQVVAVIDRHYLRHARRLASGSTFKATKALWAEFFDDALISDLSPARQRAFKAWLEARGLSPGYVRRVIGDGKAALNHAWQEGEISRVPFIRLPPVAKGYPHWARREQLVAFLNADMPDHLFTYCMIRLNTGCRGDAARDLQPFQVDWEADLVDLNPSGRQQTKKFRPVVPLTGFLRAYLVSLPMCTHYVAWKGRRVAGVRKAWHHAREAAGLPPTFKAKILRHTVGTELRRRGVPGWDVSGQFGHTRGESAPTTENYGKFDPTYLAEAKAAFEAWMDELAAEVPRMRDARAMQVRSGDRLGTRPEEPVQVPAAAGKTTRLSVVGGTGFEPVTPTMSR
jgi:integrase